MSSITRNFVFAYLFLVILPLVGLAGILRGGHHLKAPVSIDGQWTLQIDSAQLASLPCGNLLTAIPDKVIAISQSGRSLVLTSRGSQFVGGGTLQGSSLQAVLKSRGSAVAGSCTSQAALALLANVERRAGSASMTGTLSATGCSTCAPLAFRAERVAEPTKVTH